MDSIQQFDPESGSPRSDRFKLRIPARSCHRCRSRHKKCVLQPQQKKCVNCEKTDSVCEGAGNKDIRIRFSELSYVPHSTPQLSGDDSLRTTGINPTAEVTNSFSPSNTHERPPRRHSSAVPLSDAFEEPAVAYLSSENRPPSDPVVSYIERALLADHHAHTPRSDSISTRDLYETVCSPPPLAAEEAKLVKHFFTVLIPWYDYCDPKAHFRSYIQLAMSSQPCILFAVLAVSARHREAVESGNFNSNEYERGCLEILIPALNNNDPIETPDEALIISALLLRLLEEMTCPEDPSSVMTHTLSASLLLRIAKRNSRSSELINAAMAVALRQEIHVVNLTKRVLELSGHDCGIDESLGPASDYMWTLRIMSHAARVTNYAYGMAPRTHVYWDRLWQYLEDWDENKPPSFHPLNHLDSAQEALKRDTDTFPKMYYISDCPMAGKQYLELCKILLLAHDPRVPGLGLGRTKALGRQEEQIRGMARTVCAVSLFNPENASARILAGLVIGMTGELFTRISETVVLLDVIQKAEMHTGWPGLKVSPKLREFWALCSESNSV